VGQSEIRAGRRDDAAQLAVLVDIASQGMASAMWREMSESGTPPAQIGRERALREVGGFSYRHAHIVELGGEIAGCAVSYRMEPSNSDLADVPPRVRELVELEQQVPDHWYVNVLAIYPEYRGKGLGSLLLDHADSLGRDAISSGMAIIVASGNQRARKLYDRHGYRFLDQRSATPYPGGPPEQSWVLMTKPIE